MAVNILKLHSVVPKNLRERNLDDSEVWYTELIFEKGKYYHVSAPSGSGKTTLAHLLYGLRTKFAGSYHIGTEIAKDLKLKEWSRLRKKHLSIIFQDLRLFDNLTARQNILVKNELTEYKSHHEIDQLAESLEVQKLLGKEVKKLSQGEKQRIAIIRGLCQPFEWIILDEPFSHLDPQTRGLAIDLIKSEVKKREASLIALQLGDDDFFDYHQKLKL